jgi:hypothetical protein
MYAYVCLMSTIYLYITLGNAEPTCRCFFGPSWARCVRPEYGIHDRHVEDPGLSGGANLSALSDSA